jgi:hypothetical protein
VFSKTLDAARHPGLTLVNGNIGTTVAALKSEPGRDIWLFFGGSLFASLLAAQVVDQIEVAVMPVLLGGGTPLVSAVTPRSGLILTRSNTSPSGIVNLQYQVNTRLANERCSRQALFGCGYADPATLWLGGYADVRLRPVAISVRRVKKALVWPVSQQPGYRDGTRRTR